MNDFALENIIAQRICFLFSHAWRFLYDDKIHAVQKKKRDIDDNNMCNIEWYNGNCL